MTDQPKLPHHDELTGRALLPKTALIDGAYYVGRCRNAEVARWSAEHDAFFHWRVKFGRIYVEKIKHPIDDDYYDVFRVVRVLDNPKFEIPFDVAGVFRGVAADLQEYEREMWPAAYAALLDRKKP